MPTCTMWPAVRRRRWINGLRQVPTCFSAATSICLIASRYARRTCDRRGVLLQAGTCLSRRVRNGIPNSYNLVTLQRYGNERRMSIERRDFDAASGRFVMALQHEATSLMDRQRTRLNGWRLASQRSA